VGDPVELHDLETYRRKLFVYVLLSESGVMDQHVVILLVLLLLLTEKSCQ
jgi:hypothetical protein